MRVTHYNEVSQRTVSQHKLKVQRNNVHQITYRGADQTRTKGFVIRRTTILTLAAVVVTAVVHIVVVIICSVVDIVISGAADGVIHKLALIILLVVGITAQKITKRKKRIKYNKKI